MIMQASGICVDKFGELDDEERAIMQEWAWRIVEGNKRWVLLVVTNRGVHEFTTSQVAGIKRKKMKHLRMTFFEQYARITRSHSGQAAEIEIYADSNKLIKHKTTYVIYEYGALDTLLKQIKHCATRFLRTRCTLWVVDCHLEFLMKHSKAVAENDSLLESFLCDEAVVNGVRKKDILVVMTTKKILCFPANYIFWHQLTAAAAMPWWTDSSRFMSIPPGIRGWEVRFLGPALLDVEVSQLNRHKLGYDHQRRKATLTLPVEGSSNDDQKRRNLINVPRFEKALLSMEFHSYANATYWEQRFTMATGKAPIEPWWA